MPNNINTITQHIETQFDVIENNLFSGEQFSPWRGSFEVKKTYLKKENADIKCDLDIRLAHWPEGVFVKVYKHKALGVLPYVKDRDICTSYLNTEPTPCKFWKDSFYFSDIENLDQARYVLLAGNEMSQDDTQSCIDKIILHIEEINQILLGA